VTATEEIRPDAPLWVVAISTQIGMTRAEDCVELPWASAGHPETGLKQRCEAVCTWLEPVRLQDIQEIAGKVPGRELLEILRKVGKL